MKKNKFINYTIQDLRKGGIYFPRLLNFTDYKSHFSEKELKEIRTNSEEFFSLSPKEQATRIVKAYFNLDNYGYLNKLERLDWATQLIDRKAILEKLDQDLKPYYANHLQLKIFTLLNRPIASSNRYLFYSSTKNIWDLAIGELHAISKKYLDDGTFDHIDHILGQAESDPDYVLSAEEDNLISSPIENHELIVKYNKPVLSINLNMNDSQLKKEFENYLKQKRLELNINASFERLTDGKIKSLIQHSVLQYLDLKIIQQYIESDRLFTHAEYTNHLFPEDHPDHASGLDKFRDSTLKHAKTSVSEKFIHNLLASVNRKHQKLIGIQ